MNQDNKPAILIVCGIEAAELQEYINQERRAAAEAMRERCKLQIRKYALSTDELQLIAMLDELPLDSDGGA